MTLTSQNGVQLPRAVLRRSAAIEQRIADMKAAAGTPPPNPETPPAVTDPQATKTPETPPASATPTPPAPPAPPVDPHENDAGYWKHRFLTTEGVLRTTKATHEQRMSEADQRINELQEQLRTLQANAPAAPLDVTKAFTPEEIEKYGIDQCRAVLRGAQAAADEQLKTLIAAEIQPLKDAAKKREDEAKQRQKDDAAAEFEQFKARIRDAYPAFDVTDVSPGWIEWLKGIDDATGLERNEILQAHAGKRNVTAIVKMFRVYEQATKPAAPPVAPHGGAGDATGGGPAPAAPNQVAALTPPTDAEVRDFYKRAAQGRVKPEERVEFEAREKLRYSRRAAA